MKKTCVFFLVVVFVFVSTSALADESNNLVEQAALCFSTKEYNKGLELYKKVKSLNPRISMYNAACMAALAGDKDLAFEWLNDVLDNGYNLAMMMLVDVDLDSVRKDCRWEKLERKADSLGMFPKDKSTAYQLMVMYVEDQQIRLKQYRAMQSGNNNNAYLDSLGHEMVELNKKNSMLLDSIITKRGWLGYDIIGKEASNAVFCILQHSSLDMIVKYLPEFREAVLNGNSNAIHLAYVEDRCAVWSGKKQKYGTQSSWDDNKQAYVIRLSEIEDSDRVNERRKSIGLNSIEDYAKSFGFIVIP